MEKRKLSAQERAVWGKCPVCGATSGKHCKETDATGTMARMQDGAHLGRLHTVPDVVEVNDLTSTPAPKAKPKAPDKRKKATA